MDFSALKLSIFCLGLVVSATAWRSEKCDQAMALFDKAMEMVNKYNDTAETLGLAERVGINIANREAVEDVICPLADARTLDELYNALPIIIRREGPLEMFKVKYELEVKHIVEDIGGYTNMARQNAIKWDTQGALLPMEETQEEKTRRYVKFFEVMQVRYGPRWLALLFGMKNQDFAIEDPEDFATKLAADVPISEKATSLALAEGYVRGIFNRVAGKARKLSERQLSYEKLSFDAIEVIGDIGLLNLE